MSDKASCRNLKGTSSEKIFDKKDYNALDFEHCLEQQIWRKISVQDKLDSMQQFFTENFTIALLKNSPPKICFIRKDKKFLH